MSDNKLNFDDCYKEFSQKLYGVAFRMVGNHEDALDIVQGSFLKAYKNWDKFQGNSKISTWLYRIVMNLSYDLLRRRNKIKKVEFIENYKIRNNDFGGERTIEEELLLKKIKEEIEKLTPKQKTIFILRTYEELSYQEIANVIHSRVGTVKATYFQIIQKLRKNLKEKGEIKNGMQRD